MSTDLEDYVNVDYFAVNNIEFTTDFDTSMTSLVDKEYVVVSNSDPDDDTMTEREDIDKLDNNLNITNNNTANIPNISHPIADETVDTASMTSDGGHSDTATSTQILDLTLSAITKRMDDKLHLKQLKRLKNLDRNIQCHRKYKKYTQLYKWIVLFCSIITFCIYSYYYYQYFHSDKYKQAMYITPSYNKNEDININIDYHEEQEDDYNDYNDYNNDYEEREHEEITESYEYQEYYEYKFQQRYYHHRYGYYHDYNDQQPLQQQEQYDVISWLWRLILFIISLIICFTSLQIFGVTNPPPKNE